MNDATITGFDERMCICCGGLMIAFIPNPNPNVDYYLVENNPADLGITEKSVFPIHVTMDWVSDSARCVGRYIKITRLKVLR